MLQWDERNYGFKVYVWYESQYLMFLLPTKMTTFICDSFPVTMLICVSSCK